MNEQLWQAVMPFIAPRDNLIACLDSMGEISIPLLIVDNSPESDCKTITLPNNVEVVYHPENLGVPASWNMGIDRGAKWTLIISASMRFGGRLKDYIEGCTKRASAYGLNPRMAFHLYVIGRAMVDEIGRVDEIFYPSYWDDTDMFRRMIRSGITGDGVSELPYFHPPYVTCIGDAIALKTGKLFVNMQGNLDKYIRKWGGEPSHETFDFPYNNPALTLKFTGEYEG